MRALGITPAREVISGSARFLGAGARAALSTCRRRSSMESLSVLPGSSLSSPRTRNVTARPPTVPVPVIENEFPSQATPVTSRTEQVLADPAARWRYEFPFAPSAVEYWAGRPKVLLGVVAPPGCDLARGALERRVAGVADSVEVAVSPGPGSATSGQLSPTSGTPSLSSSGSHASPSPSRPCRAGWGGVVTQLSSSSGTPSPSVSTTQSSSIWPSPSS